MIKILLCFYFQNTLSNLIKILKGLCIKIFITCHSNVSGSNPFLIIFKYPFNYLTGQWFQAIVVKNWPGKQKQEKYH